MIFLWLGMLLGYMQVVDSLYNCSSLYSRTPDNSDLRVDCGTNLINLAVNLCTAQWAGFDPSGLALNGKHNVSQCQGTIDTTVDPPVIRYQLPVNNSQDNPCRQSLQIVDEMPSQNGPLNQFSGVQSVIITSYIDTPCSSDGVISYSTDLYYHFSCRYPLEYLLNSTKIVVSSVSVATSDNNGTFIDSLQMSVFNDTNFSYPIQVPEAGIQLRTQVYVEVKAINLTGNFHVLLDHCFATPSPFNSTNSEQHDFFIGCITTPRASVIQNGASVSSRFSFEAFRFVQHRNQDKSSIYLHCIVRLCEPSKCLQLLNSCNTTNSGLGRRRRSLEPFGSESKDSATVSAGPMYTKAVDSTPTGSAYSGDEHQNSGQVNMTELVVGVIFALAGAVLVVLGGWFAMKRIFWACGRSQPLA
ncbi:zona pellucida-like domain-containing protein 1 [Denticeps clupeoides]|nr:zona pellucida-like domain-containing protein 1 [Denticeps clupeoides]XP_028825445.1 zona pellucida-like domain-containing protein 1 [Denticeps clupeoides]